MKRLKPKPRKVFVAWNEAKNALVKVKAASKFELDKSLVYEMSVADFEQFHSKGHKK